MRHSVHFEPGQPRRTAKAALRDWIVLTFAMTIVTALGAAVFQSVRALEVSGVLFVATVCLLGCLIAQGDG